MKYPRLTIRSLRTVAVSVPMKLPLGTSAATVRSAPLLLIDLETEEGITGRTYLFCYMPLGAQLIARVLHELLALIKGDAVDPVVIGAKLQRQFRLIGARFGRHQAETVAVISRYGSRPDVSLSVRR